MDAIYRFRSTSALLKGFQELEKQEIYFASRNELNDPMEGLKDVLWVGDPILWGNLLNHYLLCLMHTVLAAYICGPTKTFGDDDTFVFHTERSLATPQLREIYREIREDFYRHQDVGSLPDRLSTRRFPVRRNELTAYVRFVHLHALNTVLAAFENHGLMPSRPAADALRAASTRPIAFKQLFDALDGLELRHPDHPDISEVMSAAENQMAAQMAAVGLYNGISTSVGPAWQTIISEFPEKHVHHLEKLLYVDWYTACFVSDPSQAAMWGHYGDGHKGICLKFRTHVNSSGLSSVMLGPTNGTTEQEKASVALQLYKIDYQDRFIEIDYFRSLGILPQADLQYWYNDSVSHARSPVVEDIFTSPDVWREKYWANFYAAATTKLTDWKHENEYRLILHSLSPSLSDSARKMKYRFADLQGMIFGIRTPVADKLEIVRTVEAKCRAEGRSDFEFYQAYYSPHTGKIDKFPLTLLKFAMT